MDAKRIDLLEHYLLRLNAGEDGLALYHEYQTEITSLTPDETVELMNNRLKKGESVQSVLDKLEKFMHVFSQSHKQFGLTNLKNDSFLGTLHVENEALKRKLDDLRKVILLHDYVGDQNVYLEFLNELTCFNAHYLKKENLLFPLLESKQERFAGLKIMWALHDAIRTQIKKCRELFQAEKPDEKTIDLQIGSLYFALYGCIDKEERILFPIANEILSLEEMDSLLRESFEYGFPLIESPLQPKSGNYVLPEGNFKTDTGSLSNKELLSIFSALPVDLTFVDANDKVRFFSKAKERIFPRTAAILGRDVRNCHPPGSVHVVLEMIDTFKKGIQDSATFWIQMGDKFILIQYFALRDDTFNYLGTLEVSQNVSEIRSLEGQKRILSWKEEK